MSVSDLLCKTRRGSESDGELTISFPRPMARKSRLAAVLASHRNSTLTEGHPLSFQVAVGLDIDVSGGVVAFFVPAKST